MNLLLQDPFQVLKEYPERLSHTIPSGSRGLKFTSLQFTPDGNYLICGCNEGTIIIYDMDTMRPALVLGNMITDGHVRLVQDICINDIYNNLIMSSSRDTFVKIWNLNNSYETTILKYDLKFDSTVWNSQWLSCTAEPKWIIVNIFEEKFSVCIDIINDKRYPLKFDNDDNNIDQGYVLTSVVHPIHPEIIVTGSSKGYINFFQIDSLSPFNYKLIMTERVCNSNIKKLLFAKDGQRLFINCSDRSIRQYQISIKFINSETNLTISLEHKYQDVINRLQWNDIKLSNNSADYLVASPRGSSNHELYIWETNNGSLVRVLEGAEEELLMIDWNYKKMTIAAIGLESGDIYCWSLIIQPKWSALAPDFEEVEENIDYQEKEDEFDDTLENVTITQDSKYIMASLDKEKDPIDLVTIDPCDVRGNKQLQTFILPTDYQSILMLQNGSL